MVRFKLTSPGVLLILAVLAACGIFLLDTFFLRPHIDRQRDSALQEEAVKTRSAAEAALQEKQADLHRCAENLAGNADLVRFLLDCDDGKIDEASAQSRFLLGVMHRGNINLGCLVGPDGRVRVQWTGP